MRLALNLMTGSLALAGIVIGLASKSQLFYFLLLSLFIGGMAGVVEWIEMGLIESTIAATVIELVFPPVMLFLHRRAHTAG